VDIAVPFTQFQPSQHGFHFSNNDLKLPQHGGTVLCGGMAYAAIDYFVNGMTVPHDIEAPLNNTPLNDYIFGRQVAAHVGTANKFVGIFISVPVISPALSGFSMDPDVEFAALIKKLNTGKPCPICLANPGFSGHHLVAMGCNPKPPITITAYDPNAPGKTAIIQEFKSPGQGRKFVNSMGPSKRWEHFFVDTSYVPDRPNVVAGQKKWRWCNSCMGLFFGGNATNGACPKGGNHNPGFSANYWLSFSPPGQSNWRWCRQCEGLFFAGNNTLGICPKNPNGHDGSQSADYFLTHNSGAGQQSNWRWCRSCQGLFFAGGGTAGVCPANPAGHDRSQSGDYILSVTTE
jgi:hypothetical protein